MLIVIAILVVALLFCAGSFFLPSWALPVRVWEQTTPVDQENWIFPLQLEEWSDLDPDPPSDPLEPGGTYLDW